MDWLYGATALEPSEEPPMFTPVPLASAEADILTETGGVKRS
ncbi:hypothetical protein SAMN06265355_10448 [Actinomadura mexicana]|uniref:Uncharacterized protein n=1 Tax=Actinomadura mexicana TaxID=134959 RepID=A0A238X822_9ACTN|nr:hypothetical protein SAMN06265355_10448 [Actinomadura mexicana]